MKKNKIHSKFVTEKLKNYAKEEKKPLGLGILLTMIQTSMEIIGPLIIGYILNHHIHREMVKADFFAIIKLLGIYLIIYLCSGLFSNLSRISFERAANRIAYAIQKDVYRHVQELPISYFDALPAGNIVSRITNDTNRLKAMFQVILAELLTSLIMFIGIYLMIIFTNFPVALLLLLLAPIIYIIFIDLRVKTARYTTNIRKLTADINASINENIQNMEIIQVFNEEDHIKDEFNRINRGIFANQMKMTKVKAYGGYRAIDALQYVGTVLVLLYFGTGRITGAYAVSIGSMYIVIDYVNRIFNNITKLVTRFGEMEQAYVSGAHVFDLLHLETADQLPGKFEDIQGDVSFEHVKFSYVEGEPVLRGIDFKVQKGESSAFVGATGSGKSTIINLLLNFYSPDEGRITIDQRDIAGIDRHSLREQMAVVLQDGFLFETSIRENISLGDDFTTEEIEEALIAVGGENIVHRGIEEKILEKGSNLSQGEQQLIAFARAYIRNPKILILDEATANIDTETESIIQRGVDKLKEDRTTFIVAHRLSTIKNVDKIFVLHRGKIIEEGNHESLMKIDGFYKNMYDEQMRNLDD
ncbi:MAG: ABC transporter ATP-binding protein [Tissierellia bacterium]|nr:ABC transporter ATP-binding protein [Tissierellia bacterium]